MLVLPSPRPQSRMEVVYEGWVICSSPRGEMRAREPWADTAALLLRTSASLGWGGGGGWEPLPSASWP